MLHISYWTLAAIIFGIVVSAIIWGPSLWELIKSWFPKPGVSSHPNPPNILLDALGALILHYNNMQDYWVGGVTQYTIAAKGVIVNKIFPLQASVLSKTIQAASAAHPDIPLSVALALMSSESVMDPHCQNGNFAGSNPSKALGGMDIGVCQLKVEYITGCASLNDAYNFALDPTKVIPYFYNEIAGKLDWAKKQIGVMPSKCTAWNNPFMLACGSFKDGPTGVLHWYQNGQWNPELNNFVKLETYWAGQLKVSPVLPPIPTGA